MAMVVVVGAATFRMDTINNINSINSISNLGTTPTMDIMDSLAAMDMVHTMGTALDHVPHRKAVTIAIFYMEDVVAVVDEADVVDSMHTMTMVV